MNENSKKINISTTGDVYSINYSMNLSNNKSLVCKYVNSNNNLIDKSIIKYVNNIIISNGYTDINKLLEYNNKGAFSVIYNLFDDLTVLPENAFKNCNSLISVSQIPDTYTKICKHAFDGCYNLNNINLHNNITKLEDCAFDGCKMLRSINVSNITEIGKRTFAGTGITLINLNNNINALPSFVFSDCTKLKNFEFNGSLDVYEGVFAGCTSLTSVQIDNFNGHSDNESNYNILPNYIFAGCINLDIDNNNVNFIDNITNIGVGSLMNCLALKNFPHNNIEVINKYGFKDCINLETISLTNCTDIDDYAFKNCQSLKSISLDTINSLNAKGIFEDCINLKNVNISQSITQIGDYCFKNCKSLLTFDFTNIESIGAQAFLGCESLGLQENNEEETPIDNEIDNEFELNLTNVSNIEDYAFANCLQITSLSLNNEVALGEGVFMNCISLKEVELPESINNFTVNLFNNCTSLEKIEFTSSIEEDIELSGLSNCNKINSIIIPESSKYKVIDNKVIIDKDTNTIIYVVKDLSMLEINDDYYTDSDILYIDDDAFNNSNISILNINENVEAPVINEKTFSNISNNNFHVLISRSNSKYSNYLNILGNNKIYSI